MSFGNLQWLFPIVITLHNAEEAICLPDWYRRDGRWQFPINKGIFRFATAALAILAFAVTWMSTRSGKQSVWTYLEFGYMVAALANVLIPHVAASVALRKYIPGLATSVVLNLPVLSLLVVLALREDYVSGWKAAEYSVGVAGFLVLSIAAMYKFGRAADR